MNGKLANNHPAEIEASTDSLPESNSISTESSNEANHPPVLHATAAFYQGPLPPPEILAGYDRIQKGFAERIMSMAEANNSFRMRIQEDSLQATKDEARLGQIFGLTIGIAGLAAATTLGIYGQSAAASIIGGATLIGLVTVFVTGRGSQNSPSSRSE